MIVTGSISNILTHFYPEKHWLIMGGPGLTNSPQRDRCGLINKTRPLLFVHVCTDSDAHTAPIRRPERREQLGGHEPASSSKLPVAPSTEKHVLKPMTDAASEVKLARKPGTSRWECTRQCCGGIINAVWGT